MKVTSCLSLEREQGFDGGFVGRPIFERAGSDGAPFDAKKLAMEGVLVACEVDELRLRRWWEGGVEARRWPEGTEDGGVGGRECGCFDPLCPDGDAIERAEARLVRR